MFAKNYQQKKSLTGFTLIELLVAISIIALLSSIILIELTTARARARDASRESEMKSLQTALALYETTFRKYPSYTDVVIMGTDQLSVDLVAAEALNGNIHDPINSGNLRYVYNPTNGGIFIYNGSSYRIQYYLETDTILGRTSGLQYATP